MVISPFKTNDCCSGGSIFKRHMNGVAVLFEFVFLQEYFIVR